MGTTYHVKLVNGYLAPSYSDRYGMARGTRIVPRVEDAEIFSRVAALTIAREMGGTPVMLTSTGKVRVIHP